MPQRLTARALNRALLARQLLLERSRLPLAATLDAMAGLQAQYAPSMYVGLWSRMEGFERHHLTAALEDRSVVQGTLLRSTIHLVSAGDYWPFAIGTRAARQTQWLRATQFKLNHEDMAAKAAVVRERLGDGPLKRKELDALVGKPESSAMNAWVDMVRIPPSGTWERRRADLYASAEEWLGPPPPGLTVESSQELLMRRERVRDKLRVEAVVDHVALVFGTLLDRRFGKFGVALLRAHLQEWGPECGREGEDHAGVVDVLIDQLVEHPHPGPRMR